MPHRTAGDRIEPPVSVPIANATMPAAVAAADPADEPLDPSDGFHGLFERPPAHWSPNAISPVTSLATSTAPAASSLRITVASAANIWPRNGWAPHVVGRPAVATIELSTAAVNVAIRQAHSTSVRREPGACAT